MLQPLASPMTLAASRRPQVSPLSLYKSVWHASALHSPYISLFYIWIIWLLIMYPLGFALLSFLTLNLATPMARYRSFLQRKTISISLWKISQWLKGMVMYSSLIKSIFRGAWCVSSLFQICYKMPSCMPINLFKPWQSIDLRVSRFKSVGPNAMRERGIGTAHGHAIIMRGLLPVFLNTLMAMLMCSGSQLYYYINSSKRMCSNFVLEANIDLGKRYDSTLSVYCRYSIQRHINDFSHRWHRSWHYHHIRWGSRHQFEVHKIQASLA
jgi:hypothetical protein